jgi:DNA-binding NarL/FixJ family response regulator
MQRHEQIPLEPLSPRQLQVLQAFADGQEGYCGVADHLGIGRTTVHKCLIEIRYKLAANSTAHAVAVAKRLDMIT